MININRNKEKKDETFYEIYRNDSPLPSGLLFTFTKPNSTISRLFILAIIAGHRGYRAYNDSASPTYRGMITMSAKLPKARTTSTHSHLEIFLILLY